tara:strand:+ start:175 stop:360 length:186 start_codon:yes stop_codon:yes gene_type:complete
MIWSSPGKVRKRKIKWQLALTVRIEEFSMNQSQKFGAHNFFVFKANAHFEVLEQIPFPQSN